MNYVTNYYKNLSEQLQEKVNVLNYKLRQLNEMTGPPGGAADDLLKIFEKLLQQLQNGKLTIEKFIERLQTAVAQHQPPGGDIDALYKTWNLIKDNEFLMKFIGRNADGTIFKSHTGSNGIKYLWFRTKNGKVFRMDEDGHIILVKEAKDSPYGRIVNGSPKVQPPKVVERPTVDGGVQNATPNTPRSPKGSVPPGQSRPEQVGD